MSSKWAAVVLALVFGWPAAHAADGPYLGGGIGIASFKDGLDTGGTFDQDDASYRLLAGWRFDAIPLIDIAVETTFTDFGKPSQATAAGQQAVFKLYGTTLAGLLILPLGPLDLYGKAGVLEAKLERTENGATTTRSGASGFYGAGIGFYLWKLGIRAEYERYQVKDIDRVQVFSLNALFQF